MRDRAETIQHALEAAHWTAVIVAGMLAATFLVWALAITAPNSTAIEIEYGAQDQVFQGNRFPRERLALLEAMRSGPIALRGGWAALFRV